MRRWIWTTMLIAVVCALPGAPAGAGEAVAEREGVSCEACHVEAGSRRLTDRGLYYRAVGTLDGYEQLTASFGSCGHCHARKPGSRKLTRAGKRFAKFVGDMKELREWLEQMHPPFGDEARSLGSHGGREPTPLLVRATD